MRYKVCVVYMNSIRLFLSNLYVAAFGTRCIAVQLLVIIKRTYSNTRKRFIQHDK